MVVQKTKEPVTLIRFWVHGIRLWCEFLIIFVLTLVEFKQVIQTT